LSDMPAGRGVVVSNQADHGERAKGRGCRMGSGGPWC
jgi:hypothetical protein